MSKLTLTGFMLLLLLLFISPEALSRNSATKRSAEAQLQSGTLQKMIVENGSVTMDLDPNRLNGISSVPQKIVALQFTVAANSLFSILVFNDLLRGPQPGSMALIPEGQTLAGLPVSLSESLRQLVIEKLPWSEAFDVAVRDAKTGFTFFYVEGHQYEYNASAQLFSITDGRLLVSKEFARALGRPSDAGLIVGTLSIGAAMQPIEIQTLVNGEIKSVVMPPLQHAALAEAPTLVAGPDVIVGDLPEMAQYGSNGTFVGLGVGTTSCNNGTQPVNWFQLQNTDHPVIPQNLYRMSHGASNNERFEQLGQSWMKHAFEALENNQC